MNTRYETIRVPSGNRKMKCSILRPTGDHTNLPGILWIHGGGYVSGGSYLLRMSRAKDMVKTLGMVAVSPNYRLAGAAPYPAALDDCYAALVWMFDHADELGIDRDRISVGGESAEGGLTAALCMLARDRSKFRIKSQFPLYPMIDCEDTPSSRDNHAHIWNTRRNHYGWSKYLAGLDRTKPIPPYASPARQADYRNLPRAYTFVCDGEPFYCETLQYVENLKAAGVAAECDVYHANTHAFDMLCPWLHASREAKKRLIAHAREMI